MLPKETEGQGIPEKSSDWTCIEKSARGALPEELPTEPAALAPVVEARRVCVRLLSLDCACEVGSEPRTTMDSEVINAKVRVLNVSFLLPLLN
jgi:hypothetical protein